MSRILSTFAPSGFSLLEALLGTFAGMPFSCLSFRTLDALPGEPRLAFGASAQATTKGCLPQERRGLGLGYEWARTAGKSHSGVKGLGIGHFLEGLTRRSASINGPFYFCAKRLFRMAANTLVPIIWAARLSKYTRESPEFKKEQWVIKL